MIPTHEETGAHWPTGISKTEQSLRIQNLCAAYVYGLKPENDGPEDPSAVRAVAA